MTDANRTKAVDFLGSAKLQTLVAVAMADRWAEDTNGAVATTAGHEAVEAIDQAMRALYTAREALVSGLLADQTAAMERSAALLAESRARRVAETE